MPKIFLKLNELIKKIFFKYIWHIYIFDRVQPEAGEPLIAAKNPRLLSFDNSRSSADPHLISLGKEDFLFFEDIHLRSSKGRLLKAELGSSETDVVLDSKTHFSNPSIFEFQNKFYLLPESSALSSISLFESDSLNGPWKLKRHLLSNLRAADPTLFFHRDFWWLFFTRASSTKASLSEKLCLYFARSLDDDFKPHALNPIISDASRARMAGKIIQENGNIFRPAQNCLPKYGTSIKIFKILELTPTHYKEELVQEIKADLVPGMERCHGISITKNHICLDFAKRKPRYKYWMPQNV